VSIYSNTETSLSTSTLAIRSLNVQSRDVRSHVLDAPSRSHSRYFPAFGVFFSCCCRAALNVSQVIHFECSKNGKTKNTDGPKFADPSIAAVSPYFKYSIL